MPLLKDEKKMQGAMVRRYGKVKGKQVFWATINKGANEFTAAMKRRHDKLRQERGK